MMEPRGYTIFCDDIRHEIGGKTTLVGCYNGSMNFSEPGVGRTPKFCAQINFLVPVGLTFETALIYVQLVIGDEIENIAEVVINNPKRDDDEVHEPEGYYTNFTSHQVWTPFEMKATGVIQVRAQIGSGEEIKLGALEINIPS